MGFKMSIPYLGLTRKVGESGKHKAYGRKICLEAGYERASKSHTLDRTMSDQNVYEGYRSGVELWEELERRSSEYRVEVKGKTKDGKEVTRTRGLRKDAIVGFAAIFKPPEEVIAEWDDDARERFFADCHAVARELEPELFQESNILMVARHRDEGGEHEHVFGVPLTSDGRYNGSDLLNGMRRNFNKNFARCMRARGWDVDDLDLYDAERAQADSDYQVMRRNRRKQYGLSTNEYSARDNERKAKEAKERELAAREAELQALHDAQSTKKYVDDLSEVGRKLSSEAYIDDDGKERLGIRGLKKKVEAQQAAIDENEGVLSDQSASISDNERVLKSQVATMMSQAHIVEDVRAAIVESEDYARRVRADADEYAKATRDTADEYANMTVTEASKEAVEIREQAHAELDEIDARYRRVDEICDEAEQKLSSLDVAIEKADAAGRQYVDARDGLADVLLECAQDAVAKMPDMLANTEMPDADLSIVRRIWNKHVLPAIEYVGDWFTRALQDSYRERAQLPDVPNYHGKPTKRSEFDMFHERAERIRKQERRQNSRKKPPAQVRQAQRHSRRQRSHDGLSRG